jgi:hypothetical protein
MAAAEEAAPVDRYHDQHGLFPDGIANIFLGML